MDLQTQLENVRQHGQTDIRNKFSRIFAYTMTYIMTVFIIGAPATITSLLLNVHQGFIQPWTLALSAPLAFEWFFETYIQLED